MKLLLDTLWFSVDRTSGVARIKCGLKIRWYVPQVVKQVESFGSRYTF